MCEGIIITNEAKKHLTNNDAIPLSLFEYPTTSGISLVLPDNIYVNAQFSGKYARSPIILDYKNDYFLNFNNEITPVKIIPLPDYFNKKDTDGNLYTNFIMSHTDRMRINPIWGCYFTCKYCDFNKERYKKIPFVKLKEAIDVALADKNIQPKHLLISGGTPKPEDRDFLDSIYEQVTKYLLQKNITTDIMLAPRKEKDLLKKLKSWGVNSLSINLEIYQEELAKKFNPEKAKISREFYFQFIKDAVMIFGISKVRSILIIGLEPISETLKGVEEIAKLGSDIVLSPFMSSENIALAHIKPPTEQDLIEVYEKSKIITDKYGVTIGPRCIPCQHNTLAFPNNSSEYFFS
ncbi:Radical SAM domain protein [sediment metagenome]|uniref:Radical SAM domain protein n=1 Tax=sediment metagenome TaxID=749907 RepID=D9PK13_9ZZZZ